VRSTVSEGRLYLKEGGGSLVGNATCLFRCRVRNIRPPVPRLELGAIQAWFGQSRSQ